MKKFFLILIISPCLIFGQGLDAGIKLQAEYLSVAGHNTGTGSSYDNNDITPALGVVLGLHISNIHFGLEGLWKFQKIGEVDSQYFPAFAGYAVSDSDGTFVVTGAHGDYTLTNSWEFYSPWEFNLYIKYHVFENFAVSLVPYFSPINRFSSQHESWQEVVVLNPNTLAPNLEEIVVQDRLSSEWVESGIHLGATYRLGNIMFDLRIPILISNSTLSGEQVSYNGGGSETIGLSGEFKPKKGIIFSAAIVI
tara:strand:+ start:2186 stop:2938 length:753 start_codon:yes stop_codon:yes gene_type:complete